MNVSLRDALSAPDSKRRYTRWVFSTIAARYDLANVLLSFNRDRGWKRRMVERARVRPGEAAIDLACGTGDISLLLAHAGARVVGLDITREMIDLARAKAGACQAHQGPGTEDSYQGPGTSDAHQGPGTRDAHQGPGTRDQGRVSFLVGDMLSLPFPDCSFDLVTTAYGIRNVPDLVRSLHEARRVLRPGGRLLSLDFDRPPNRAVRWAYLAYLSVVGSALGWAMHRHPNTYRYIPETIRTYPGAPAVVSLLRSAGFEQASYEPVFGGFMALHLAVK